MIIRKLFIVNLIVLNLEDQIKDSIAWLNFYKKCGTVEQINMKIINASLMCTILSCHLTYHYRAKMYIMLYIILINFFVL